MKKKNVEFKVGEDTLRGTLFIPDGKGQFPGVVFYHGRGSTRARYLPMAESLAQKGIIGLAFDFRGCGESDGEYKNQTHRMGVKDATAGLQFLLEQNIDRKKVGIQGTSFGGYVTGMLLNDPQYQFVKSIVLRVPAAYSDSFLDTTVHASEEKDFFLKKGNWIKASSYKGLAQFMGDLLVIRSEKDELILAEAVNKYYEIAVKAKRRELSIHKNAGHSLSDNPKGLKEFHEMVVKWFLNTL